MEALCPDCGANLSCPPEFLGRELPCPNCGADVVVPVCEETTEGGATDECTTSSEPEKTGWRHNKKLNAFAGAMIGIIVLVKVSTFLTSGYGSRAERNKRSQSSSVPALPAVGSAQVMKLMESLLLDEARASGGEIDPGSVRIEHPVDIGYDKEGDRRLGRAVLTTNLGTEVVFFSVSWHDQKKGVFWIQFEDDPNAPAPVAVEGGGEAPGITTDEWVDKVIAAFPAEAGHIKSVPEFFIMKADTFFAKVGEPHLKQVLGEQTFLYWRCTDGMVQLVVDTSVLGSSGGLLVRTINRY